MLSIEAARTANTQCVSTSKKEQLSPTSPQHCGFMFLLFVWLTHGGALCFQPAYCWSPSRVCAQTPPCPQPQITPSLRGDLFSPRGQECPMSPLRAMWWFRQPGGKHEEVLVLPRDRRELNSHTPGWRWLPCIIQPWQFNSSVQQFSSSSFLRKKSQMFRDAGTARTRQQLQSGIAFLDLCDWHSFSALSWVPWLRILVVFTQLYPPGNLRLSFSVYLCFVVCVLCWRSVHRRKREPLPQGDTAALSLLLLSTGVQPGKINLKDHKLCTLQLGV